MQGSESAGRISVYVACCAALALMIPVCAPAQVFVVQPEHISQHYAHFQPTQVQLPAGPMTTIGREELIRFLQSEQGFAMRPLPVAVLTLRANGDMEPTGDKYIDELHTKGVAAKPGDRVQITDIRIKDNRIIIDLNNGPYHKHRFMRHISISMNPYDDPTAMNDPAPTGSRIVLIFPSRIPDVTGEQVEQLLKPMIDFGVRSPAEAYAETLPDFLRKAILEHRVLVGMDHEMVLYAKGQPDKKDREEKDGKPFEIWIYGEAPDPVEFVRFDGSFVARVEIARVGEPVAVQTANQMGDFWGTQPANPPNVHTVALGDRTAQSAAQQDAPPSAPTLRKPGETLPTDNSSTQVMHPVKFPPGMQRPGDPGYTPPASGQSQPAPANGQQGTSTSGQQTSTPAQTSTTSTTSSTTSSGTAKDSTGQKPSTPPPNATPQLVSSATPPR